MRNSSGAFVPTTSVWDTTELFREELSGKALQRLMVKLYQNLNNQAMVLNVKDSGYYDKQDFVCGQLFFPNSNPASVRAGKVGYRPVHRVAIEFGALPNNTTKSVAHGITMNDSFSCTRIYGTSTNKQTNKSLPLPYVGIGIGTEVELWVDGTNVNIKTAGNLTTYLHTYVIIEFIKT